jgi:hypothetical protein
VIPTGTTASIQFIGEGPSDGTITHGASPWTTFTSIDGGLYLVTWTVQLTSAAANNSAIFDLVLGGVSPVLPSPMESLNLLVGGDPIIFSGSSLVSISAGVTLEMRVGIGIQGPVTVGVSTINMVKVAPEALIP